MPDFPQLRTGVVMQYPARRQFSFVTTVLRFIDGTEQRFRWWPSVTRQWIVRLDLLTEGELSNLRDFHRSRSGQAQSFRFIDPWDGAQYENCTFDSDDFEAVLRGDDRGDLSLVVRESR